MMYHLIVAASGVAGLFALWLGVQALVRKHSKEIAPGDDVLACRTCGAEGACGGCAAAEREDRRENSANNN